jgi:hypothetical protein
MAERLNTRQADSCRDAIQTTKIINGLQDAFEGKGEKTAVQVNIARILLDKSLASLQSIEQYTEHAGTVQISVKLGD